MSGAGAPGTTVLRASPADGSTNVPENSTLTLELSKPIDPFTVNASSIVVTDETANATVDGTLSVAPNGMVITFGPKTAFPPGDAIRVTWSQFEPIADLGGNRLVLGADSFTISTAPVTTPLAVTAAIPPNGASGVATNVVPHLTFTSPLDGATLSGITLKAGSTKVNVAILLSNGNQTLSLLPPGLLAPSTAYTITVAGVTDVAGNALSAPLTYTFTTATGADLGPQVVSSSPANNDVNVPTSLATATVTFNEPIDPATAIATNCSLQGPEGNVPVTLSLSADGLQLTFTIGGGLDSNASYQLVLTGLADYAGNAMAPTGIGFTTGN